MRFRAVARKTSDATSGDAAFPGAFPYPKGWFCAGFSDELPPGKVLTRPFMGEDIVLYRTRSGKLRATLPYCPHLGAHLGVSGSVRGEELVCAFHGFAFAPDGVCARTGYGTSPPKARLTVLPVHESGGTVLVWHHHKGIDPEWEHPRVDNGYAPPAHRSWDLAGYPQDIGENAVDTGHLTVLHGMGGVSVIEPLSTDGQVLTLGLQLSGLLPMVPVKVEHDVVLNGISDTYYVIRLPKLGADVRVEAYGTPTAPGRSRFHAVVRIRLDKPGFLSAALRRRLAKIVARIVLAHASGIIAQDFPIWHHRKYVERPRLAAGDGPILQFRRWSRQFYPAPDAADQAGPADQADG